MAARWRGEVRLAERLGERLLRETDDGERPQSAGVGHGMLCWVSWRDGDMDKAAEEGQAALQYVQLVPMFPNWWLALAPLIPVALHQSDVGDAVAYARHMLDPSQQLLPPKLNGALATACSEWDAGNDRASAEALDLAVRAGRGDGYT